MHNFKDLKSVYEKTTYGWSFLVYAVNEPKFMLVLN